VLNTERVSVERCVEDILALLVDPRFRETPESKRAFANLALQTHVRAALRTDPRTAKANVVIEARDGKVTLAGILEAGIDPTDVLEVIGDVKGVSEIENTLRVAATSRFKLDT